MSDVRRDEDRPVERLTLYFDAECALCVRLRGWLANQPQLVPIDFAPAQAPGACPLEPAELLEQLTVIGSNGEVWRGAHAWLVCLWALQDWRGWSLSLSAGLLLPLARRVFDQVSRSRQRLGAWLCLPRVEP